MAISNTAIKLTPVRIRLKKINILNPSFDPASLKRSSSLANKPILKLITSRYVISSSLSPSPIGHHADRSLNRRVHVLILTPLLTMFATVRHGTNVTIQVCLPQLVVTMSLSTLSTSIRAVKSEFNSLYTLTCSGRYKLIPFDFRLYYPVAILKRLRKLHPQKFIGVLYDIGCHLDVHIEKVSFVSNRCHIDSSNSYLSTRFSF